MIYGAARWLVGTAIGIGCGMLLVHVIGSTPTRVLGIVIIAMVAVWNLRQRRRRA